MRQFFKHFGSKARLAEQLPPPRFSTIIEPFAGSAAYAVQHATPAHSVLLFELKSNHSTGRTRDGETVKAHEVYWTNERRDRTGTLALFGSTAGGGANA